MQALFSPAVALMNRIRYNTKFLLIGGAVTLVILVLLSSVYSSLNRDIESARNEQAGLQMLKPINQVCPRNAAASRLVSRRVERKRGNEGQAGGQGKGSQRRIGRCRCRPLDQIA